MHKESSVAATALDQLVQDYGRQKQELEAEIAERRAAWEDEAERTDRERKEQEEGLRKQRQREAEDFEYKKTQERKKAQDKYDEEFRLQEKKNQEKQETLEKSWQLREATLKGTRRGTGAPTQRGPRHSPSGWNDQKQTLPRNGRGANW